MPTMRAISRMDFPCADNSCMVLMVPLLIMATSLVSKFNTSVALVKGWVNSFLALMGQLYLGFYKHNREHARLMKQANRLRKRGQKEAAHQLHKSMRQLPSIATPDPTYR